MQILGTKHRAIMDALRDVLGSDHTVTDLDPSNPIAPQLEGKDVWLFGAQVVTRELIEAAPKLRLLHQIGRGHDKVDLAAADQAGVPVAIVRSTNHQAVADYTLTLMLSLARGLHLVPEMLQKRITSAPLGRELSTATVAILGLGACGSAFASRCRALGMHTIGIVRNPNDPLLANCVDEIHPLSNCASALGRADFVSLHIAANGATRGLANRAFFDALKPGAYLINTSRAAVVNRESLEAALESGSLAGAALDVFWKEPADPADPLLHHPRVVVTNHLAGFTQESVQAVCVAIANNLGRLERGEELQGLVRRPLFTKTAV